jgi:protein required for attachment to host cells
VCLLLFPIDDNGNAELLKQQGFAYNRNEKTSDCMEEANPNAQSPKRQTLEKSCIKSKRARKKTDEDDDDDAARI